MCQKIGTWEPIKGLSQWIIFFFSSSSPSSSLFEMCLDFGPGFSKYHHAMMLLFHYLWHSYAMPNDLLSLLVKKNWLKDCEVIAVCWELHFTSRISFALPMLITACHNKWSTIDECIDLSWVFFVTNLHSNIESFFCCCCCVWRTQLLLSQSINEFSQMLRTMFLSIFLYRYAFANKFVVFFFFFWSMRLS